MRRLRIVTLFAVMFGFWILLSGKFTPVALTLGVVSAALSTWLGARLAEAVVGDAAEHNRINVFWLVIYVVWLLGRMISGAVEVARIVIDPRDTPRPGVMTFTTQLRSPAARTLLANSITLVPGTITLEVDGDELTVHSFTPSSVDDLVDAQMQNRIAAVFREPDQPRPRLVWEFGEAPSDRDPESFEDTDTTEARP